MVYQSISAGIGAIKENIAVIRAKFRPLLRSGDYLEDVTRLVVGTTKMLDNMEAMAMQLEESFETLSKAPKKEL